MEKTSSEGRPGAKPCPQCNGKVRFHVDSATKRKSCPLCDYELPNQIAHFKLEDVIGTGGMGAVYMGMDLSLERKVAVKVMREKLARNPQFVESFLREARAAAALSHPNVAQIYSFGEENSRFYLVMELLPGGSLDDKIENQHRVPELEVLDVGIQVAGGLRAAYERGLIHRDIKPGNILFAMDGTAKVVDFGLARFEEKTSQSSPEEGIWGTPYYIAPEKVSENKEDFRSDIYSLGGTLFHALAGRAPFEAGTSTEVVLKHLHASAVSLRAFAPDCTPQTAEVISRMLKREPSERPQSYDELLNDLAYAKRFALEKKPQEQVEAESEFSMATLVSTLLIMLICVGAGIWLWMNRAVVFKDLDIQVNPAQPVQTTTNKTSVTQQQPQQPPQLPKPPVPPKPPANTATNEAPQQPSQPDYAAQIEKAHDVASRGGAVNAATALAQFEETQKNMSANHELQPWLRLHIARAKLMVGRDSEALAGLTALAGATSPETWKFLENIQDAQRPQVLAQALLGKLTGEALDKTISKLPEWLQAVAHFDAGLAAGRKDDIAEVARHWQVYVQAKGPYDPKWSLAYQPIARDFVHEHEKFAALEKEVAVLQTASKFSEIQRLLQENQAVWQSPSIRTRVAKLAETNRQALATNQKELEEKKNLDQARQIEAEGNLLDEMRSRKPTLLAAYQFEQLLEGWKALAPKIKTETNRQTFDYHLAVAQCLADYKAGIVKDVAAFPYDQERLIARDNRKMTGKLHQIRDEHLWFSMGEFGDVAFKWTDLPPSGVLELGKFYLQRIEKKPEPNNSEIARRYIALAVLAREYALPETLVRQYLGLATRTGANVKDTIDKLFPATPPK
ncbi:MAG: serine/threonine protein kinase [Verrucomicrobia bacterium]|nr:serine/threonine protein kinase [Verrucomicrobiota bacterium]